MEVDLTAVAKVTAETEAVLKEDSAEETDTHDGSDETQEVDLTAVAKARAETEEVLKKDSEEIDTDDGSGKQWRLI